MKYLKPATMAAAAIAMSAAPLHAGGMAEPRLEAEVIAPEVVSEGAVAASTGGFVLPLLFLVILAAAATDTPRE